MTSSPETSPPTPGEAFLAVAKFSSAFACGVMAGFLYSLKRVNPALELELGVGSLLMALMAAGLTLWLWNIAAGIRRRAATGEDASSSKQRAWLLIAVGGILFLGMFSAYLAALKDVRRGALLQVLQGTTLAIFVICGIGMVLYRLVKLLNRDEPPTGSTGEPNSDTKSTSSSDSDKP